MTARRVENVTLTIVLGLVALTALAGGAALIIGSIAPAAIGSMAPPLSYLDGSPFTSYLLPGVILGLGVGGLHAVAFVLALRGSRWRNLAATICGYEMLVWIFVQMIFIPFSALQIAYAAIGLLEIGLVLLSLGVLSVRELPDLQRVRSRERT
jgi:hypothetical protein